MATWCDVELKSHDLSDENAKGITYQENDDAFVIVLDPNWATSEAAALYIIRHEACHVATCETMDPKEVHDAVFQECMKRFMNK
jgi:hypothetical protein